MIDGHQGPLQIEIKAELMHVWNDKSKENRIEVLQFNGIDELAINRPN